MRAELGTEDEFNEDEGTIDGELLLELLVGKDDSGEVEAGGTGPELIESTVNKYISNGKTADLRTSRLQKKHQQKQSILQQKLR